MSGILEIFTMVSEISLKGKIIEIISKFKNDKNFFGISTMLPRDVHFNSLSSIYLFLISKRLHFKQRLWDSQKISLEIFYGYYYNL